MQYIGIDGLHNIQCVNLKTEPTLIIKAASKYASPSRQQMRGQAFRETRPQVFTSSNSMHCIVKVDWCRVGELEPLHL